MRMFSQHSCRSSARKAQRRAIELSISEFLESRRLFSTFTVTSGADSGTGSLRQEIALAEAAGSGTQDVQITTTATIALDSTLVIASNANLVITYSSAESGSLSSITTSGAGATLQVSSGATVVLSGLAISAGDDNGSAATVADTAKSLTLDDDSVQEGTSEGDQGSALSQSGGSLTVNDCTFTGGNDSTSEGGGIYDSKEQLTIYNSSFSTELGNGTGGGIYNAGGTVSVYNTDFTSEAIEAGAVENTDDGTLLMTGCQIDTYAAEQAGGIENDLGSSAIVEQSTFDNCFAQEDGGAVWNLGTFTGMTDTFVQSENESTNGGALSNQGGETFLYNCTFDGNLANGGTGGAIDSSSGILALTNCTITDNLSENQDDSLGAGISIEGGFTEIYNSIVAGNDGVGPTPSDIFGTVSSGSYDLIGYGGSGGLTNGVNGNIVGVVTPDLGALGSNGGATMTIAPLSGSPALGAGSTTLAADEDLTTDQRGFPRVVNGKIDIGAYETQPNNSDTSGLLNLQFTTGPVHTGAGVVGASGDKWTQASPALTNTVNPSVVGEDYGYENLTTPSGAASSVQVSFEAGNGYNLSGGSPFAGTYVQNLMEGYLISFGEASVNFTGLAPNTTYELYLYSGANTTGRDSQFTVGVPDGTDGALVDTVSPYAVFNDSDQTLVQTVNYAAVTETSDSEGRIGITFAPGGLSSEADLNGIQIEPIDAWTGAADGVSWNKAGNWSENQVPTSTTNAVIGTGFSGIQVPDGLFEVDSLTASSPITVETGGVLVLNGNGSLLDGLTLDASGAFEVATPPALTSQMPLVVSDLTIVHGGVLDLGSSAMVVPSGSLATINSEVATGYNGGDWDGTGIISSAAHADSTHLTTLGVILNNNGSGSPLYGSGTALGPFDNYSPTAADVLVKYTYYGDANLDGKVNAGDYSLIDNGYLKHLTGWYNGDFNYDGLINGSDYTLIDNAFNKQGSQIGSAEQIATPAASVADGSGITGNAIRTTLEVVPQTGAIVLPTTLFQSAAPITFSDPPGESVEDFLQKKDLLDQLGGG